MLNTTTTTLCRSFIISYYKRDTLVTLTILSCRVFVYLIKSSILLCAHCNQIYKKSWWAAGQRPLPLVCFTLAVWENPTDCPSQKIPSKRLRGWICVSEAKVDAAELSLFKVRGHSVMAGVCVILDSSVDNSPNGQGLSVSPPPLGYGCVSEGELACKHIYSVARWLCAATPVRSVVWNMQ